MSKVEPSSCIEPVYGLRDYQRQVVRDALQVLRGRKRARVVLHLPTGAGKTRVASSLASRLMLEQFGKQDVFVWLASAEELVDQAAGALGKAWAAMGDRTLDVTVFKGGSSVDLSQVKSGFLVCSLAKLYGVVRRGNGDLAVFAPRVAAVVFDEAHQAVANTYELVTDQLSAWSVPVIGLTATPGRHCGEKEGSQNLADFFMRTKVTIETPEGVDPMEHLIRRRFLSRPVVRQIERDGVAPVVDGKGKEFERILHRELGESEPWLDGVREAIDDALERYRRILVFAPSVDSAKVLAREYAAREGVASSDVVVANTIAEERSMAVERFCEAPKGVDRRLIFNYAVFTAGFDAPATDAVVIGQPTKSLVRYSQMVGRALRGCESGGTDHCCIYTVTDASLPGFAGVLDAFLHWEELW